MTRPLERVHQNTSRFVATLTGQASTPPSSRKWWWVPIFQSIVHQTTDLFKMILHDHHKWQIKWAVQFAVQMSHNIRYTTKPNRKIAMCWILKLSNTGKHSVCSVKRPLGRGHKNNSQSVTTVMSLTFTPLLPENVNEHQYFNQLFIGPLIYSRIYSMTTTEARLNGDCS